jgi:hypothetical protein
LKSIGAASVICDVRPRITPTVKKHIALTGIKHPTDVQSHFATYMVDVAGVSEILPDSVRVEVDESIDLHSQSDRDWVLDLIKKALAECGEAEAQIQVI